MQLIPIVLYLAAAWFVASGLIRLFLTCRKAAAAPPINRLYDTLPPMLNLLGSLLIAISLILGGPLFFDRQALVGIRLLALSMPFAAGLDLIVAIKYRVITSAKWMKLIWSGTGVLIACVLLVWTCYLRSTPGYAAESIQLDYPFRGIWKVAAGGRMGLTNYHHANPPAQDYAIDLVNDLGPSDGETVFAPTEGVIATAVGDRAPGGAEPEGNVIVIESQDGVLIWLAHLRQGSVSVKSGDRVRRGQPIAACGATGSAETAHLHIHAQRGEEPVPMFFGEGRRFLLRNERVVNESNLELKRLP